MKNPARLIFSIIICELVGIISIPFTLSAIPNWYQTLIRPPFSPPNWIFAPVWTILYFMMGVSLYIIWQKGAKNKKVKTALIYFYIQLFLNFLWSFLFFGLHSPILGLMDILALWIFIILSINQFSKINKTAAYILIPYLFWVSFASILNYSIVMLNP